MGKKGGGKGREGEKKWRRRIRRRKGGGKKGEGERKPPGKGIDRGSVQE